MLIDNVLTSLTITGAALLLVVIVAGTALRRRGRANNRFELGSVSQQWLVGHKGGDER